MKILGKPSTTIEQCQTWINGVKTAHPMAKAMVPLLWDAAIANGIDPTVLIAQAMKETGYFNFKGVIRPNFCNTCGLKVTKGGGDQDPGAHMRFEYWEDGIMAHSDHLALYAGADNQPKYSPDCGSHQNEQYKHNGTTKDPRHFTYLHGDCTTVEDLSGKWCPSADYGQEIVRIANQIINTKVEKHECLEDEVGKYKELYEKTKSDLDSVMYSFNELKTAYYEKENELNVTDKLLVSARDEIASLTTKIDEMKEVIVAKDKELEEKTNELNVTNDLLASARETIGSLSNQLDETRKEVKDTTEQLSKLQAYKNKIETELDCSQLQNDRLNEKIDSLNNIIKGLKTKIEELEKANAERPKNIFNSLIELIKNIFK